MSGAHVWWRTDESDRRLASEKVITVDNRVLKIDACCNRLHQHSERKREV